MSRLGVRLTLLVGPGAPIPAPLLLTESLETVRITHKDQGRSGFQITFQAGRSGPLDLLDHRLLLTPLLQVMNRVILIVTYNVRPRVLMDGIITRQELAPSDEPGKTQLTVTGEDVSVMMDREERVAEYPALPDVAIVATLLARYPQYGLVPMVIAPKVNDVPNPVERVPVQQGTDLEYIEELARRHGHVFHVTSGPAPLANTAYWGPPERTNPPQRALSVNMGELTNVDSISFAYDALAPESVEGVVTDRRTQVPLPVKTLTSARVPPLATSRPLPRVVRFREVTMDAAVALERAQGRTDLSADSTLTATGKLDAIRYGDVLTARGTVGLRGAGRTYDGFYYVREVTHEIRRGSYTQDFTLTREGVGTLTPAVVP